VYELGPGTETCPSEETLIADVAARLGYDPFRHDAARQIVVKIAMDGDALEAKVQLVDETRHVTGERVIPSAAGADCRELASSLAFAVSIALDPLAMVRPSAATATAPAPRPPLPVKAPAASEGATARPTPPAAPTIAAPSRPPAPPRRTPVHLRFGAGSALSVGAAPSLAVGFGAFVGVQWPRASLSLEGRLDVPASRVVRTGTVEGSLILGALVPCVHLGPALGCAVLAAGGLRGTGSGVDRPRTDTTFFAAVGPRLALEYPVATPLAFRAWIDGLATVTRTSLSLDGAEAWRTPPVAGTLGAGLVVRFP
jgi:hypothetical protein